jgi:predicted nucleic acid-binding Zn ribbon protein
VPERDSGDRISRAREALAAARADARARGLRPARSAGMPAGMPAGSQRAAEGGDLGAASQPAQSGAAPSAGVVSPGTVAEGTAAEGTAAEGAAAQGTAAQGATSPAQGGGAGPAKGGDARLAARRVRRDDPQPLGTAINGLLEAEGWTLAAATGSVFARWADIVGADLAGHTTPESLRDGELTIVADSTAWATQLRLLAAQLVRRLNAELGDGSVQRVRVRGPVTGTRRPGEWRVRGSRGPRDTYG